MPPSRQFTKLIRERNLNMARIPLVFMNKWGAELGKTVRLQVGTGKPYKMDVVRNGGDTYLGIGWRKFRDHYALEDGDVLTFHYKGDGLFKVTIEDGNGKRVTYPWDKKDKAMVVYRSESSDEEAYSGDDKKKLSAADCGSDSEDMDSENDSDDDSDSDDDDTKEGVYVNYGRGNGWVLQVARKKSTPKKVVNVAAGEGSSGGSGSRSRNPRVTNRNPKGNPNLSKPYSEAFMKATKFVTKREHFVVFMNKSFVTKRHLMGIPTEFANNNFHADGRYEVAIRFKRHGTVNCVVHRWGITTRITKGWKACVNKHGIKYGDACVFEVDERQRNLWHVTIFKA